jgi:nicotinamidase-related amidase
MARLVEAARAAGVEHVASSDQHELSDPEISQQPDLDATWPPHCLLGTPGAEKIAETKQLDPLPLPLVPLPQGILRRLLENPREILVPKKHYDPFMNPNTETMLDALDPDEILLFGVATDVCDDARCVRSFDGDDASRSSRTPRVGSTRCAPPRASCPGSSKESG